MRNIVNLFVSLIVIVMFTGCEKIAKWVAEGEIENYKASLEKSVKENRQLKRSVKILNGKNKKLSTEIVHLKNDNIALNKQLKERGNNIKGIFN